MAHEVHHAGGGHAKSPGALALELLMIGVGVFLGLQVDQWRESRNHRESARAALENFREEFVRNRKNVAEAAPTYKAYADSMQRSETRGDPPPKSVREVFRRLAWHGTAPIQFDRTAWDLALATQSLSYLPRPLAFSVARVDAYQQSITTVQMQSSAALFNPAALDDAHVLPWLVSFSGYLGGMNAVTPQMIEAYDRMIPRLDSALKAMPE